MGDINKLYDNIKQLAGGKIEVGTVEQFTKALGNQDTAKKIYGNLSTVLTKDQIGSENDFLSFVNPIPMARPQEKNYAITPEIKMDKPVATQKPLSRKEANQAIYGQMPGTTKIGDVSILPIGKDYQQKASKIEQPEAITPTNSVNSDLKPLKIETIVDQPEQNGEYMDILGSKPQETGIMSTGVGDAVERFEAGAIDMFGNTFGAINNFPSMVLGLPTPEKTEVQIAANEVAEYVRRKADRYKGKDFKQLWKDGDKLGAAGDIALAGAESLPGSLLAMFGGGAGLLTTGASAMTQQYDKLRNNKTMSEDSKRINSMLNGTIQVASEFLGDVPIGNMLKGIATRTSAKAVGEAVGQGLKGWIGQSIKKAGLLFPPVGEGLEEVAAQVGTNVTDYITGARKDWNPFDGAFEAGVYGMGAGAGFSVAGGGMQVAQNIQSKKEFKQADTSMTAMLSRNGYTKQEAEEIKQSLLTANPEDRNKIVVAISGVMPDAIKQVDGKTQFNPEISNVFTNFFVSADNLQATSGKFDKQVRAETLSQEQQSQSILQQQKDEAAQQLVDLSNKTTGTIQTIKLKDNSEIQIANGTPIFKEDGTFDAEKTGIITHNPKDENGNPVLNEDGTPKILVVDPNSIMSLVSETPVQEAQAEAGSQIDQAVISNQIDNFYPKDVEDYNTEDGIWRISVNETTGKLEKQMIEVNENAKDEQGRPIVYEIDDPINITDEEYSQMSGKPIPTSEVSENQNERPQATISDQSVLSTEPIVSTEPSTDLPQSAPTYPTDKNGNVDFKAMTDEQIFNHTKETKGEEAAHSLVGRQITRLQAQIQNNTRTTNKHNEETNKLLAKAKTMQDEVAIQAKQDAKEVSLKEEYTTLNSKLGELQSLLPKVEAPAPVETPKVVTTRPEILQLQKEQAQANLDSSETLTPNLATSSEVLQPNMDPSNEVEETPVIEQSSVTKPKETPFQKRAKALGEYIDMKDYILRIIAGGQKIKWKGGLESEFRGSNAERLQRRNYIDETNGLTPTELAHQIWNDYGENGNNGEIPGVYNMSDGEILDEVHEVLRTVKSNSDALLQAEERRTIGTYDPTPEEAQIIDAFDDEMFAAVLGITNFTPEQITTLNDFISGWSEYIQHEQNSINPGTTPTSETNSTEGNAISEEGSRTEEVKPLGESEKQELLRNTKFIETGETRIDKDYDIEDAEYEQRKVYVPIFVNKWDYAENTDPDIEKFDTIDEALKDLNIKGDMSEVNAYYTPTKETSVELKEVWLDRNGNEVEESDKNISYYDWAYENKNNQFVKEFGTEGSIEIKTFDGRESTARELESKVYFDLNKSIIKEYNGLTIKSTQSGKYRSISVENSDGSEVGSIKLRIADHSYNPRNNDIDSQSGNFISIEIANKNETEGRFNGSYGIQFDGENTFSEVVESVNKRIIEIIDGWNIKSTEEVSKEEQFNLTPAKDFEQFETNINWFLKNYGSREMAAIQVELYLNEKPEFGKEYIAKHGITTTDELKIYLGKLQAKLRAGKGNERKAVRSEIAKEKTERNVDEVIKLALEAEAEMQEAIRQSDLKGNSTEQKGTKENSSVLPPIKNGSIVTYEGKQYTINGITSDGKFVDLYEGDNMIHEDIHVESVSNLETLQQNNEAKLSETNNEQPDNQKIVKTENVESLPKSEPSEKVGEQKSLEFPKERVTRAWSHAHMSPHNTSTLEERTWNESGENLRSTIKQYIPDITDEELSAFVDQYKSDYLKNRESVWISAQNTVSSAVAGRNNFNKKQADQRGSSLDRAEANFDQWNKKEIQRIENESGVTLKKAEEDKAKLEAKENKIQRTKELKVKAWTSLKAGDDLPLRPDNNPKILKKNKFSVETEGGAKWTLKEIFGVDHKEAQIIMDGQVEPKQKEILDTLTGGEFSKTKSLSLIPESFTVQSFNDFEKQFNNGEITLDAYKKAFEVLRNSKDAIIEELGNKKKDELINSLSSWSRYASKNEKKDRIVKAIYDDMLMTFTFGSIEYDFSTPQDVMIGRKVEKATQKDIDNHVEEIQKQRAVYKQRLEEHKKALTNPETLPEFRTFIDNKGMNGLSIEQKAAYDNLITDKTIEKRDKLNETKSEVSKVELGDAKMSDIIETKHTKTGDPLFVVKLSDRVEKEVYHDLNSKAKKLGGGYSSYSRDGAVPGFQFKGREQAEKFISLQNENASATPETAKEDKIQERSHKLRDNAQKMIDAADVELNRERLTNTNKRASEASRMDERANGQKRIGQTMLNIANAIDNGDVKLLSGINAKTHIELLDGLIQQAQYKELNEKYSEYSERQKHQGEPATLETIEHLRGGYYPSLYVSRLKDLIKESLDKPGVKRIATKWEKNLAKFSENKNVRLTSDAAVQEIQDMLDVSNEKYFFDPIKNSLADHKRLKAMGIENDSMLRAALREYIQYRGVKGEVDKVKQLERNLVGKNVGIDFFPTPKPVVNEMLDYADIQEGMSVLEPSAGNGNIADAVKEQGYNIDVIEISNPLREVLEAKGYNLVGTDFMEFDEKYDRIIMNPPFGTSADIDHVLHAYDLLNQEGKLVAVMSESTFFRNDAKSKQFREFLDNNGAEVVDVKAGAFNDRTLLNTTGVKTRIVVIDKNEAKFQTKKPLTESTPEEVSQLTERLLSTGLAKEVKMVTPEEMTAVLEGNEQLHAVYHGSPHSFDQFSLSHIGTGEGAQAYGHGLYFTDKKGIAEDYANKLADNIVRIDGKNVWEVFENPNDRAVFMAAAKGAYNAEVVLSNVEWINTKANSPKIPYRTEIIQLGQYGTSQEEKYKFVAEVSARVMEKLNNSEINISKNRNLYSVELHEGKQPGEYDYLRWDKPVSSEIKEKIFKQLRDENVRLHDMGSIKRFWDGESSDFESGDNMYGLLSNLLGSQKEASEFLLRAGIDGIQYPANHTTGKANETDFNYVVFDPSAITIKEKVQFMRKPDGTIYGFVKDGVVYLNSEKPNLNTPIHEFGHLFTPIIKFEHPEFYQKGVELIKESPYYDQVKNDPNYSNLDEDGIIDEAMNQAIGDKGEKVVEKGLFERLKEWIKGVWERIGAKFGIKNLTSEQIEKLTLNDWTDVVNSELLNGKKLDNSKNSIFAEKTLKEKQLDIINESNPMLDDYHTGIRSVADIKTLEEAISDPEWDYDEYNPDYTKSMAQKAIETGKVTVYSSNPIKQGVFVSPSKMEAESYSGNGKVYAKEVNTSDVAWIDPTQGQYAEVKGKQLPTTIDVDGIQRPTTNSTGKPIHSTEEGIRNFWKWFGDSKVIDESGRPLVVYHGGANDISIFDKTKLGSYSGADSAKKGFFFTNDKTLAEDFAYDASFVISKYKQPDILKLIEKSDFDKIGKYAVGVIKDDYDFEAYDSVNDYLNQNGYINSETPSEKEYKEAINKFASENLYYGLNDSETVNEYKTIFKNLGIEVGKVSEVNINIENPLVVEKKIDFSDEDGLTHYIDEAIKNGNDGVIFNSVTEIIGGSKKIAKQYVVFEPTQIKSATGNDGSFSENNTNFVEEKQIAYENEQEAIQKTIDFVSSERPTRIPLDNSRGYAEIHKRSVVEGFKESGYVDFIGRKINSIDDVVDMWNIHRSPYIEKSHIIFVKDGSIVGTTATTLNKVGITAFGKVEDIETLYNKFGADGMYLLHNHPSGNHKPSSGDIQTTQKIKDLLPEVNLIGHIVIDHDKYSYIDPTKDGYKEFEQKNSPAKLFYERELVPENNPQKRLFEISKALLNGEGLKGAIIYLSPKLDINAYDVFPEGATQETISELTKQGLKNNLGQVAIITHDGTFDKDWKVPANVVDVIDTKTGYSTYFENEKPDVITSNDVLKLWEPTTNYPKPQPPVFTSSDTILDQARKMRDHEEALQRWQERQIVNLATQNGERLSPATISKLNKDINSVTSKLWEGWADAALPIKEFQKFLEKNGVPISDNDNYYMRLTTVPSRIEYRFNQFKEDIMKPFIATLKAIEKNGFTYDDITTYAKLKHGPEYTANILVREYTNKIEAQRAKIEDVTGSKDWTTKNQKLDQKIIDFKSTIFEYIEQQGIDYAGRDSIEKRIGETADNFITNFESENGSLVDEFWKQSKEVSHYALDEEVRGGMKTREWADGIKNMFEYYVPLKGHREPTAETTWDYSMEHGDFFFSAVKKGKGRTSESDDPFSIMESTVRSAIGAAEQNLQLQSLRRLALKDTTGSMTISKTWFVKVGEDENGNPEFKVADEVPFEDTDTNETYNEKLAKFEEKMKDLKSKGEAYQGGSERLKLGLWIKPTNEREHEVVVKSNGESYTIRFHTSPRVPQAINGTNMRFYEGTFGAVLDGLGWATRHMAGFKTLWRPAFILITNPIRDIHAGLNLAYIDEGAKFTGNVILNFRHAQAALLRRSLNQHWDKNDEGKKFISGKYDKMLNDLMVLGGKTGISKIMELKEIKKSIEKQMKSGKDPIGGVFDFYHAVSDITENQMRVAIYITAIEKGYSSLKATSMAKEATLNFDRKGNGRNGLRELKATYAFINVGFQAIDNIYSKSTKNSETKKRALLAIAANVLSGSLLVAAINTAMCALFGWDEDKWLEDFSKRSSFARNANFTIWTPEKLIDIPLGQEFRMYHGLGMDLMMMAHGKVSVMETSMNMIKGLSSQLPYNPIESSLQGSWASAMPDFASPLAELAANKSWLGYGIYKQNQDEAAPGYTKIKTNKKGEPYAPEVMIKLSKWLNEGTGGDAAEAGWLGFVNPDIADHLLGGYFAGIYEQPLTLLEGALSDKEGSLIKELAPRAILKNTADIQSRDTGLNEKYYKAKDEAEKVDKLIGRAEKAIELLDKKSPDYEAQKEKYQSKIDKLKTDELYNIQGTQKTISALEKSLDEISPKEQVKTEKEISELKKNIVKINNGEKVDPKNYTEYISEYYGTVKKIEEYKAKRVLGGEKDAELEKISGKLYASPGKMKSIHSVINLLEKDTKKNPSNREKNEAQIITLIKKL